MKRNPGLSLVEMMIAVAIAVLLAGMVFAATSGTRERGRQAVCISNLKQISMALHMYVEDNGGAEPNGRLEYWQLGLPPDFGNIMLVGYVKDRRVWYCPNDPNPKPATPSYVYHWWPGRGHLGEFAIRPAVCGTRLPLLSCVLHGMNQGTDSFEVILRWDGQVKGQFIRVPRTLCYD